MDAMLRGLSNSQFAEWMAFFALENEPPKPRPSGASGQAWYAKHAKKKGKR